MLKAGNKVQLGDVKSLRREADNGLRIIEEHNLSIYIPLRKFSMLIRKSNGVYRSLEFISWNRLWIYEEETWMREQF